MGLIFYNFLRDMLTLGANSLENMAYITLKVNFPRQIVVLSAIVNASVTYVINLGFIFAIMIISGISFSAEGLLNLALLSLATLLLALAISLPLSVALVRFTDIKSILELTLFLLFWVTPIMYDVHSNFLPEEVQPVIAASPLTYMINQARASLNIYTEVNFTVSIVIIVIALILLAICWPRFDKWTQKVSEYY
jgi:ABC-2 type transport system permease protein